MILMPRYLTIAIIVCLDIHSFDRVNMHTLFISTLVSLCGTHANSIDPDQMLVV